MCASNNTPVVRRLKLVLAEHLDGEVSLLVDRQMAAKDQRPLRDYYEHLSLGEALDVISSELDQYGAELVELEELPFPPAQDD